MAKKTERKSPPLDSEGKTFKQVADAMAVAVAAYATHPRTPKPKG